MCSHAGHSNNLTPVKRIAIKHRDLDTAQWMNVMQKSQQLAHHRKQQEATLDIQHEVNIKHIIYPQSLLIFKKNLTALSTNKTLKIKTASQSIKTELSAAARLLHCKIEEVMNDQYLYITKLSR